jgi:hypothetical protein
VIAAIFLLGAALFGAGLMQRALGSRLTCAEHFFFGLVIGWAVVTAIAYWGARLAGRLSPGPLLIIMAGTWLVSTYLWLPAPQPLRRGTFSSIKDIRISGYSPLVGLLCLFAPFYFVLFRTHMLQRGADGGLYSGGSSALYDLGFHAAVTTSFLYGENFPPVYTAMPPAPLLYPFLPDFQTAILVSLGISIQAALVWTGVLLALALTGIFYFFALSLLRLSAVIRDSSVLHARVRLTAVLASILFVLNGGFGFVYFLGDWWASRKSPAGFWSPLQINYANMADQGIVWTNIITDTVVAQRTSLFGLSLALIVFTLFARAWRDMDESGRRWSGWQLLLVAGLTAGLLPGFHPHSLAAVGVVSGFLFVLRPRRVWLAFWVTATILAAPYLIALAHHVSTSGFFRFQPGWRGQGEPSWFVFWIRNVGLPTILIIPAWFMAGSMVRRFYLAFTGLLIISLLIVFSPNDYDNLKLIYYWYAATVVLVADWLVRLISRGRALAMLAIVLIFGSISSGGLAVLYELQSRKLMFDRDEVAAAEFLRVQTPPRSLFLTAPSLHQPVLSLAGRAIVRGPTAWLWSHGYPFAEREADVRAIYAGRDDAVELLRYYRVDYVYLGPRERQDLRANQEFFDRTFPLFYRNADILVYDARQPGVTNDRLAPYPVREYASRVGLDPFQPLVEFRDIGYPLYRQLKEILGRPPRYEEFMTNLKTVGRGVHPGTPGWLAILEANQRKLAESWKVDNQIVTGGKQSARDYDAAYVLVHYFGYLKRDIESDTEGYNFWLRDLNRTSDYRGLTRAFIESEEYKTQTP